MNLFRQLTILGFTLLFVAAGSGLAENTKRSNEQVEKKSSAKVETDIKPSKINWLRYDDALKLARKENKHLFVDFTATWCGWCKRLEKDTFSKQEVIEMLDENFISTKVWDHKEDTLDIDGYKIREKDLGKAQFSVSSFPTMWFIAPDGQKIGPIRGYVKVEQFMTALNYVNGYKYITDDTKAEKKEKNEENEQNEKK